MMIGNNKALIGNKYYDTYDADAYYENRKALSEFSDTAIHTENYVLPIKYSGPITGPGVYDRGDYFRYVYPQTEEEKQMYSIDNMMNYSDVSSMEEFCKRNELYSQKERVMLTNVDNEYIPLRNDDDEPAMKALKDAIEDKSIDISKYQSRFGQNYTNDLRLLQRSRITLAKLVSIADNLDISAELILRDKSPDVPNPINREIHVDLTNGGGIDGSENVDG